ncbi:nuclear protein [Moniliophthora roreri MCA 2997]|uniref:Nuclear protein n=1 Tax=Moniliophthora roreri (strain MCA 2997) TaxID=1381753 RepID=V2XJ22_MONRO|nr:nuclear protein [Moniliophthora roreri MCA 2997]
MPPVTTSDSAEQNGSSSSSTLKERRFKLSRACDRCRRRRIKCDEGTPCQACLAANSPCTFEEPGKRTHPHKSKRTATLEDRMHHLETLIQAIPPAVFAAGGNPATLDSLKSVLPEPPSAPTMFPTFPSGVPPPSLHVFPLTNPSTHFTPALQPDEQKPSPYTAFQSFMGGLQSASSPASQDQLADATARLSIHDSYLYTDDEGYTRWQGETSGLPLLDSLIERKVPESPEKSAKMDATPASPSSPASQHSEPLWFPNRTSKRMDINPQTLWRLITAYIPPDLMDSLVQCYLSTSYYILPFLHVPTFLSDYGNPLKWGEPGFATFIVAICCLASRHVDDPRVRGNPSTGISAGTQWFELLGRLRILPIADRPTLYTIQADLIAAVYAVGLGRLSKAAALLSEAVTISIDAGLHRSADTYDLFDPIEDEVRKRTFWCVYIWDKQLSAHFGRPPVIRLKDCDVSEPASVDDEFITKDAIGTPPPGTECRMSAFVFSLRIMMVLESVLDVPIPRPASSPFMRRVASVLTGSKGFNELREEEALLDEIHRSIPPFWAQTAETIASEDIIRLTQAERLYCAEHFVRMLIYRHRFSQRVGERLHGGIDEEQKQKQTGAEKEAMIAAHNSALQIIATHVHIAGKGLMTYYGVHVIHQLTQAGRTLVAILLCCKSEAMQPLIAPGLDALRSCVGLLRRFSGRYVCGLRSGDLLEEFCRLTQIPLEPTRQDNPQDNSRPAWIRPVRKKTISSVTRSSQSGESHHSSPEAFSPTDFFNPDVTKTFQSPVATNSTASPAPATAPTPSQQPHFGPQTADSPSNGGFMDPTGSLNMNLLRDNSHLYLSPADMMAMFGDATSVDMFSPDFLQMPPSQGTTGTGSPDTGGNISSPFMKRNGMTTS